jgi:signal transduction histidine kinase/CheY-like chemotaxis protein
MTNIIPASIGAVIVASTAAFLGVFHAIMSVRLEQDASNKWGFAASCVVLFHSVSVFLQYNLGEGALNLVCEHIQTACFVLLIHICYRLSLHYLNLKPVLLPKITVAVTIALLGLISWPGLIFRREFIHRKFLWLDHPYIEPSPTVWATLIWIYVGIFALYIFSIWYRNKKNAGLEGRIFLFGFGTLTLVCLHDLVCALGTQSVLYLNIYGFFAFLAAIFGITGVNHIKMYDQAKVSARALALAKEELEIKVKERTKDLLDGNRKLQAAVNQLRESENRISVLSDQTEQFSRAAASMLLIEKEQDFFDTVSAAIVKYSDYQRVLISLFNATPPYREIIGFGGVDRETVDRLRQVEMPASQYDHVFEAGEKIGNQSYYIPHTMKNILKQEATVYGRSRIPYREDAWHPEDNLFVKMINERGEFIGVISVDDSKSGLKPTDDTVRPLEIFSSLISQIIVLKKEQKRSLELEEQLMAARKMESIGRLTGGIAHDFNNILGVIIGNAELVLDKLSRSDKIYADIESIQFAGNKASEIVNQLLSFSRNTQMDLKPVRLAGLLEDMMRLIKSTTPATIRIETKFQNVDSVIMADQVQLNQVFLNLCLNAAQSMENRDGKICLSCQAMDINDENAGRYPELKPGRHIRISVTDDGPGIEPDILDKIFDPYFTTKEFGKGSGIGLAVVHGIVKSHMGAVMVTSRKGEGARFDILFPVADQAPEPDGKQDLSIELGHRERVLLVDDDAMILDMMDKILKQLQYEVTPIREPEKALEFFEQNPAQFDLLITDMTMPDMSGLELAQGIFKIRPQLPVIICTGYNDVVNGKTATDLNVSALLMKPVRLNMLAREIRMAIKGKTGATP